MKPDEILRAGTTPLNAPAYPKGPFRFRGREYLNITYRSDADAVRRWLPEPLEFDEPLVRFEVMRMPDVSGLGSYTECGQAIACRLGEERGEFLHAMYVDHLGAIASGREVSAYPKKLGSPRLLVDSDTLVGLLDYGSLRVAIATMGWKHRPLDTETARAELALPAFLLKMTPGYDRRLRVCELVRTSIAELEITGAWTAPARLQLFEHAMAPLADLPVREVVAASHIVADLTLGRAEPVHDYLANLAHPSHPSGGSA